MFYLCTLPRQITECKKLVWGLHPQFLLGTNLLNLKTVCRTDIKTEQIAKYSATNGSLLRETKNSLKCKGYVTELPKIGLDPDRLSLCEKHPHSSPNNTFLENQRITKSFLGPSSTRLKSFLSGGFSESSHLGHH